MPLIVMSGIPLSGKSVCSKQLESYFSKTHKVFVISENDIVDDPNNVFAVDSKEKQLRGSLKSSVQRHLTVDDVVILDALNYIKGFRYELYCLAKEHKTTHCVIECAVSKEEAWNRNQRKPIYERNIFDALVDRYETPDSLNRWDSPLFVVTTDRGINFNDVYDALFNRKALSANQSTQSQPLSETNYLYELNEKTKAIVNHVLKCQEMGQLTEITIPETTSKLLSHKVMSLVELNKYRRQFITYSKQHPINDSKMIPTLFIQYLNGIIKHE